MAWQFRRLRREFHSIERANHVLTVCGGEHPPLVCEIPIDGQFEKVRAFEKTISPSRHRPILEVRRGEEMNRVHLVCLNIERHDPLFCRLVPYDLRVPV